ncbi:MAG: phosphate ABC transporter substrate-binding protein PstS [Acidimicrobiia bacterium]
MVVALLAGGCGGDTRVAAPSRPIAPAGAGDTAVLEGIGSTFVEPLVREWIRRYQALAPGVTINYEATGSITALTRLKSGLRGTSGAGGDFFASDVPLTDVEAVTLGGSQAYVQVPWAAGAIAAVYNLPDVPDLRLSPDTLAAMFSGRITRWDDPAVRADNPGVRMPALAVSVVYRVDGSGTTSVFTSYLDAAGSGGWGLGRGDDVVFPRGTGVRGSEAVVAAVRRTAGAVGYVQLAHAHQAGLPVARLGNRAGNFLAPTSDAVNATLAGATLRSASTTADLLFTPDAPGAYPLATVTYLLFRRDGLEPDKVTALRHFAAWAVGEGQRFAEPLGYARLPRQFQGPALTELNEW